MLHSIGENDYHLAILYLSGSAGIDLLDGAHFHLKSLLAVHIIAAREERTQA